MGQTLEGKEFSIRRQKSGMGLQFVAQKHYSLVTSL